MAQVSESIYSTKIFLNSVIPLLKVIALDDLMISKRKGKKGVLQISVLNGDEKWATHLDFQESEDIEVALKEHDSPDVELQFPNLEHFNAFFKGQTKKLPKIKGFKKLPFLIYSFQLLLKMASLLQAKDPPKDEQTKALVVKLFLYLLSSGISQLNKLGHPKVVAWSKTSPDRVYAWQVDSHPDIGAYIRVKAGKTRAARGMYKRSQPFFTMRFVDLDTALAILLQTGDLLQLTMEQKLIMEGAPEFGATIGDHMMLVGEYAQA